MITQKISEMTEATVLQDEDLIPIVQSNLNKKVKVALLRDYNLLKNLPLINNVTLQGNKNLKDLNVIEPNQGIIINSSTNKTLQLEPPTTTEMEQRSNVNKAITVKTADKMAKETAHQTMSKEYAPNSQPLLTQGENQPVSYKAVKDYVDTLETKVDTNESDIESKVSALGTEIDTLETKVDENETDIENKVSTLQQTVSSNKTELDGKITTLEQKVDTNETDIEQKVTALQGTVTNNKTELTEKINTVENKVDTNETDIEQKVGNISTSIEEINSRIDQMEETGVSVADTLPIGSVIGWDSEENYPTDIYEEVDYNPIQHIINPDFQINQRGQTSYINNTATPTYTLDMWQLAYGTINVLDNGIKITPYATQAFLNQKISDDLTDKQVTLVLKETNGEMHILQGVANKTQALSSKSGNVTLSIGYISETNLYKIGTTYDAETFVEYINLFEGDIVYPHVKNKYAYDLMECQGKQYVIQSKDNYTVAIGVPQTSEYCIFVIDLPTEMDDLPNVINNTSGLRVTFDGYKNFDLENINVNYATKNKLNLLCKVNNTIENSYFGKSCRLNFSVGSSGYISFSCEPL